MSIVRRVRASRRGGHKVAAVLAAMGCAAFWVEATGAAPPPQGAAVQPAESACTALASRSFEKAADSPAKIIRASWGSGPEQSADQQVMFTKRGQSQGAPTVPVARLPVHCRVEGYVAPAVRFLVLLPEPAAWNGKVFYAACDGFCGEAADNMPVPGLMRGYATIATDGGHVNLPPFDGIWAFNNRQGEIDFGHRSTHLAAQVVKAVAAAYYGKPHSRAYMAGFSKGGTAGVKSALLHPRDFDGILSRAPVLEYQTKNAVHFPWIYRAVTRPDGTAILDAAQMPLIHAAVVKACDAVDGLADGVIDDPRDCKFDPSTLLCRAGVERTKCLDAEQVEALRKVYSPPTNARGEILYPAAEDPGSELDWPNFVLPVNGDVHTYAYKGGSSYLKYMAFANDPGPDYDWLSFDYDRDGHLLEAMKPIYDADGTDLDAFEAAGGRLIVTHGWGDGAVSASMTIRWYEKLLAEKGGATRVGAYARLFVLPGVKHGSGGDGPEVYEGLQALESWVERGVPPDRLLMRKEQNGVVVRTRPVFPYPQRSRYRGTGSIDDAANFEAYSPPGR